VIQGFLSRNVELGEESSFHYILEIKQKKKLIKEGMK
jgi:hypothetical protein